MPASYSGEFRRLNDRIEALHTLMQALASRIDGIAQALGKVQARDPDANEGAQWQENHSPSVTSGSLRPSTHTLKLPTARKVTKP